MEEKRNEECPMVSRYEADKVVMHLNFANRRMLIALVTVCVTFIITIVVFVTGYTAREKNWLDTITHINPTVQGVSNGSQQNTNP